MYCDCTVHFSGYLLESGKAADSYHGIHWPGTVKACPEAARKSHELTALYAKREKSKGFAFLPDDEMQSMICLPVSILMHYPMSCVTVPEMMLRNSVRMRL